MLKIINGHQSRCVFKTVQLLSSRLIKFPGTAKQFNEWLRWLQDFIRPMLPPRSEQCQCHGTPPEAYHRSKMERMAVKRPYGFEAGDHLISSNLMGVQDCSSAITNAQQKLDHTKVTSPDVHTPPPPPRDAEFESLEQACATHR